MIITNDEKEFIKELITEGMLSHKKTMLINKNSEKEINEYCTNVKKLLKSIDNKCETMDSIVNTMDRLLNCVVCVMIQNREGGKKNGN